MADGGWVFLAWFGGFCVALAVSELRWRRKAQRISDKAWCDAVRDVRDVFRQRDFLQRENHDLSMAVRGLIEERNNLIREARSRELN
jgi:hypothetical protein